MKTQLEELKEKLDRKAAFFIAAILEKHGWKSNSETRRVLIEVYQQGAIDALEEIEPFEADLDKLSENK